LGNIHQFVDSATFSIGHRNLTKVDITGVSLLYYRELHRNTDSRAAPGPDHAELLIHYDEASTKDITRSEIRCKLPTAPSRKWSNKRSQYSPIIIITITT